MKRSDVLVDVLSELSGEPPERLSLVTASIRKKFFTFFESDEELTSQDSEVLAKTLRGRRSHLLA
ncbi:MAG TPA: hypothetical protein VNX25_02705 [Verrucomicrobiae bacterium]|nr:hypothetical protein [Verrucomicrobiae bacterium]